MAHYLIQFTYTSEAWAAMSKNPVNRKEGIRGLVELLGGKFHTLLYSFGEYDGLVLFEAPDDTSAAAVSIAAGNAGHLKAIQTTKLLTPEEAMEVMRKAGSVTFQAPK